MDTRLDSSVAGLSVVPTVPAWATPRSEVASDVEAAWMAGGALNSLDNLVRSNAPWLGAWRHRLALKAAASIVKLSGRGEGEADLRDAWCLRRPGDALGPAGDVVLAWRRLVERSHVPEAETLAGIAQLVGLGTVADAGHLAGTIEAFVRADGPAPLIAARAAMSVIRQEPAAEPLAWWVADLVLSLRMRWAVPVPILSIQIHSPLLRLGRERVRARPGGEGFERACLVAAAAGAADACRLGSAMAVQAGRLQAVAPKLRSKGAGEVISRLLEDDAVPGTFTTGSLSRWASRRLFERLQQLDAVRELSGRDTFRLYGL